MPKYCTERGIIVTADNPDRTIWYGQCGYWTDDWDLLKKVGPGIPCCPKCGTPGFIDSAINWLSGAEKYDEKEPGYFKCLNASKEKCYRHYPKGFYTVWEMEKSSKEKKDEAV